MEMSEVRRKASISKRAFCVRCGVVRVGGEGYVVGNAVWSEQDRTRRTFTANSQTRHTNLCS